MPYVREVFRLECRNQLRGMLFPSATLVLFLLAFLATASETVRVADIGANVHLNAPFAIIARQYVFSIIAMLAGVAFVATTITRDRETKTEEILFATPMPRLQFLFGRFAAGASVAFLCACGALLGTLVGSCMPWLDPERLGPFSMAPYWHAVWAVTAPNAFVGGAVFFTVAALTRSLYATYAAAFGLLVLVVVVGLVTDPESLDTAALFDPFGTMAFGEATRYWTVFERNERVPELSGTLLHARLLWIAVALAALAGAVWGFRRDVDPRGRRRASATVSAPADVGAGRTGTPPASATTAWARRGSAAFGGRAVLAQFASQLRIELAAVLRGVPLYVLLAFGVLNVVGWASAVPSQGYGAPVLPTTELLVQGIAETYLLPVYLIVIYYGGELVHREARSGVAEFVYAMPFPSAVLVGAKVVALWSVIAVLLTVGGLAAIAVQVADGYHAIDVPLYASGLYVNLGWNLFLLAVVSVFVQAVVGNKWLAMLAMLLVYAWQVSAASLGFEHVLYALGTPRVPYSHMNGYGHFVELLVTVGVYWSAFAALLGLAAHVLLRRGTGLGKGAWGATARQRFTANVRSAAALAGVAWVGLGVWIFYNTNVLNAYETEADTEAWRAEYERRFKGYRHLGRPQALSMDLAVDIFPARRGLRSRGTILLGNTSDAPIAEFVLSLPRPVQVEALDIPATLVERADAFGLRRYAFEPPLRPTERVKMSFDLSWEYAGFSNSGSSTRLVGNGTFVDSRDILPFTGYNAGVELTDNHARRRQGLGPAERLPPYGDGMAARRYNQLDVAERTRFKARVGTSLDQIAIAPGRLVREWRENDRRYFEYETEQPIWPFFSFQSARYALARDAWNDVTIEIFHDPGHAGNLPSMFASAKRSLDYFTREFSPYQYDRFRVVEFPYALFAQSFPNTVPYSERLGFTADLRDDRHIDFVFYVTAHEMAHQWWAHQVIGARMQGMTFLVETLAQYAALMVMEAEYGERRMRRFLKHELDGYLAARGGEAIEELPLMLVENQDYVHYRKGSLAMYALQDAIGEDAVNRALREFLGRYAFHGAPFPNSGDLIALFRNEAGPEQEALITDLFERIVLYDLQVADVSVEEREIGGYSVEVAIHARRLVADGQGREREARLDAWLDVALFPETSETFGDDLPEPILIEKHRIGTGWQVLRFEVDERPASAGIDPYHKMIDRHPEDNLKRV